MNRFRYILYIGILLLFPISGFAQNSEIPRLGTFQLESYSLPEMNDIWKHDYFIRFNSPLRLPKVTADNYQTPVDMTMVVMGIENNKKASINQALLDNIRTPYANLHEKDDGKGRLKLNSSIHSEIMPTSLYGTCVHGNNLGYCSICFPRNRFGNMGFGIYPSRMGHFYYR